MSPSEMYKMLHATTPKKKISLNPNFFLASESKPKASSKQVGGRRATLNKAPLFRPKLTKRGDSNV